MSPAILWAFVGGFVAQVAYMLVCPWCAKGAPHHTNSSYSIAGGDRFTVFDLHEVDDVNNGGVGLRECTAYDLRVLVTGRR